MKLYVGNLPYNVGNKELAEMFASYGEVSEAMVIMDKFSGRSKGFGFVTLTSDEAAQKAITEMNGKQVEGREIKVNEAKPMDPDNRPPRRSFDGPRRSSFGGGNRGGGFGGGRRERY
ncbi:MAG: RNA-binding protein [Nanoarchaeota archaeon]